MSQVLAAGVILYRCGLNPGFEYLLLQKPNEKWAPAKGRLEKHETDLEAALRETCEETGLVEPNDYEIVNKQFTITNLYQTRNNKSKRVVYYLAKVKDSNVAITLSDEHIAYQWLSYDVILSLYTNSEMTRAIVEANEYLMSQTSQCYS